MIERFRRHIASLGLPEGRALVAVSGGPDSLALLDLLIRARDVHRLDLVVAHLDHGIHPDSSTVAEKVEALAVSSGLAVHVGRRELGAGTGETRARVERYAWLEALRAKLGAEVVFTGHHADDQVETVLMRMLAGSGPAGLAGMAPVRGHLARPLLPFTRAELLCHLEQTGLSAWLDPANSDQRHLRSWIRTALLPALRMRLPEVDASLLRTSRQAGRDRAAWDAVLDTLPALDLQVEDEGISVAASSLGDYDSALAQTLIIAAARRAGCQVGPRRVERVLSLLKGGTSGTRVPLGGSWRAELAFGRLRIRREVPTASPLASWPIEGARGQGSWGRWRVRWAPGAVPAHQDRAALSAWFTVERLTIRGWGAGERLKPLGGVGRRLVVRCFQEARVPRSRRQSWPVLAQNQDIMWIPGVCRSDVRIPSHGSEALRVDVEYA
ncbi:MAG: tRNA lysidine(34) synthetase TilS [Gemmatimonadales bacterium]|nr:tRNA lysidine(34) synthetase TilS [Gemmatimonadales bacterium]